MDFDEATGTLYLAAFNYDTFQGELRTCDTSTGMSTLVGAFQGGDEVDCLAFSSYVPSDIPWLDENPKSGSIAAGGNQPVTVSYDSTGLATGTYAAILNFKNDTPYGDVDVPVTLYVWEPVASATPLTGLTPLTVTFTGNIVNGNGPYTYDWDFGDGSPHSTVQSPMHTYNVGGAMAVTFTATDQWGHSASDTHLVINVTQSTVAVVYNIYDDAGRARGCFNRLTGEFTWMFPAGAPTTTWTGTALVLNGGTKFVNAPGASVILNMTIDPLRKKASGYALSGGVYSSIYDSNITNNPPGCF
jgi:PKD repeat protein